MSAPKLIIVLSIFLALVLFSCRKSRLKKLFEEKPPEELPLHTRQGLNTFGCKVDGAIWLAEREEGFSTTRILEVGYAYSTGALNILAFNRFKHPDQSIHLVVKN